ncbi:MAG: MarR family transcriptional regulator [Woeseiaceae bacterium]|nr:MarR family transcriptional regulator [Woeseiaceae bacterium]
MLTARTAAKEEFLPLMRELVRAYQAFAAYDALGYRDSGLTVPQADVIFTLGNTSGMTFREIGERTLITKGTLTGVIDRLESKGLVRRVAHPEDRRCTTVTLTAKGKRVFEKEFPRQIAYLKERFDRLTAADSRAAQRSLRKIRELF